MRKKFSKTNWRRGIGIIALRGIVKRHSGARIEPPTSNKITQKLPTASKNENKVKSQNVPKISIDGLLIRSMLLEDTGGILDSGQRTLLVWGSSVTLCNNLIWDLSLENNDMNSLNMKLPWGVFVRLLVNIWFVGRIQISYFDIAKTFKALKKWNWMNYTEL